MSRDGRRSGCALAGGRANGVGHRRWGRGGSQEAGGGCRPPQLCQAQVQASRNAPVVVFMGGVVVEGLCPGCPRRARSQEKVGMREKEGSREVGGTDRRQSHRSGKGRRTIGEEWGHGHSRRCGEYRWR